MATWRCDDAQVIGDLGDFRQFLTELLALVRIFLGLVEGVAGDARALRRDPDARVLECRFDDEPALVDLAYQPAFRDEMVLENDLAELRAGLPELIEDGDFNGRHTGANLGEQGGDAPAPILGSPRPRGQQHDARRIGAGDEALGTVDDPALLRYRPRSP